MTHTLAPSRSTATVRPYRPADHGACRQLWAEFVVQQRLLLNEQSRNEPGLGGSDPGAGFEEYLTRLDLSGMWVADDGHVVGFVGLVLDGRAGAVDPVVVTAARRGAGIGRSLLQHVTEQARERGLKQLTISPALRNVEALHCLHAAGYDVLTNVTLALSLNNRPQDAQERLELHGQNFRY